MNQVRFTDLMKLYQQPHCESVVALVEELCQDVMEQDVLVLFECLFPAAVKRQVDILELNDLEKEYFLSRCRLTLAQHHPPSATIAGT